MSAILPAIAKALQGVFPRARTAASQEILHIATHCHITRDFFSMLGSGLPLTGHFLISSAERSAWSAPPSLNNLSTPHRIVRFARTLWTAHRVDKVILHGLFDRQTLLLLLVAPWLLPKCYWVIWGADLYSCTTPGGVEWRLREFAKRRIVRRMGHLVSHVAGDVRLAREWYGARGKHHYCLCYPGNTFDEDRPLRPPRVPTEAVQVGNSADPSNAHAEIFEKLAATDHTKDLRVYAPLAYGDSTYRKRVIELGYSMFGSRFVPLTELRPYEDYMEYLQSIDIAFFNHRRQQAMGNIISLLGYSKKVYIRSDTTVWDTFRAMGITCYDAAGPIDLEVDLPTLQENGSLIRKLFRKEQVLQDWAGIFTGDSPRQDQTSRHRTRVP